ncbi:MAG: glycoside hydrolase family 27 protein [Clostridia bacterium]|nr:glycoside hydrolase family 27 protein [Clostridia bacterium]
MEMNMKIAKRTPFEGAPVITTPTVLGCAPGKPFMLRLSAIGERPIAFSVSDLPDTLSLDGQIISGTAARGEYTFLVTAENAKGKSQSKIRLETAEGKVQRTPLMGFSSWNAFGTTVTDRDMIRTAEKMTELGLVDYGYHYVNLDSSWQDKYGGEFDAIMPDPIRFPDIKGMVDSLHSMGLKAGIYSTPFVTSWGCPDDKREIPGCTENPEDGRFTEGYYFPIGQIRKEKNNVKQWTAWGIDYLKYDWTPTDRINAEIMREALNESERDFVYCLSVAANIDDADFLVNNVNSWRSNSDTDGSWSREKEIWETYKPWQKYSGNGHYFDLDMLSIGEGGLYKCTMTDEEKLFQYSARAFLMSPIQLACDFEKATDFELDLYCNEEVIAVNQDGLLLSPEVIFEENDLTVYKKPLENGDFAIGLFNASDEVRTVKCALGGKFSVRDLWLKENVGVTEEIRTEIPPHCAKLYRVIKTL